MTVYRKGQNIDFKIPLKVLRAFALNHNIYYIVGVVKKTSPIGQDQGALWGVLNVDGSFTKIPQDVMVRAGQIVQKENLLKDLT